MSSQSCVCESCLEFSTREDESNEPRIVEAISDRCPDREKGKKEKSDTHVDVCLHVRAC